MATRIEAIRRYAPRLQRGKTVRKRELVRLLSARTGYNSSEISGMLEELRDAVIFYCLAGRGVKLNGLGTYLPTIGLDGSIRISHRLDNSIRSALNAAGEFNGDVLHRENIGKTTDDLVEIWNADHPDDQIES